MRILLVTPSYYPNIGGVEYVVKSIAERLAAAGHKTTVVTGDPKADKPREEEISGVYVIRWPTWAPSGAYHIPRMRSQLEKLPTDTARGADVVHVHNVHSIFTTYAALALKATAKLVVTPTATEQATQPATVWTSREEGREELR